jgi:hypothetical protein
MGRRRRCGVEKKCLNVNRAEARGQFEALKAAANVGLINLSRTSITNWHSEISVA